MNLENQSEEVSGNEGISAKKKKKFDINFGILFLYTHNFDI